MAGVGEHFLKIVHESQDKESRPHVSPVCPLCVLLLLSFPASYFAPLANALANDSLQSGAFTAANCTVILKQKIHTLYGKMARRPCI